MISRQKSNSNNNKFEKIEVKYFQGLVEIIASQGWQMSIKDSTIIPKDGWRGILGFYPEYEHIEVNDEELLFCYKPLKGPYLELTLWIFIEDTVCKEHIKEILEIVSRHGVSPALEFVPTKEGSNAVTLQLSLRIFTANFNAEVFDYALTNLVACKEALIEYLISIGVHGEPDILPPDSPSIEKT